MTTTLVGDKDNVTWDLVLYVEGSEPALPPGVAKSGKKRARCKAPKRPNPNIAASSPKKKKASSWGQNV